MVLAKKSLKERFQVGFKFAEFLMKDSYVADT